MATVISLVLAESNRLRYLLVNDGLGQTIPNLTTTGAASPDLATDALYGPLKQIVNAFANGLGILAAGAFTQAQARAMWMGDSSDTILGNNKIPRAICRITPRTSSQINNALQIDIDANVDGTGHPVIVMASVGTTSAWSAYLDIQAGQGEIGL